MSKQSRKRKMSIPPIEESDWELCSDKPQADRDEGVFDDDDDEDQNFCNPEAFLRSLEEAARTEPGPSHDYEHSGPTDSGIDSGSSEDSDNDKKAVWFDEEDANLAVGEALDAQHRKLPSGGINTRTNKYSNLLKRKFESVVGTPAWAKIKKPRTDGSDDNDDDDERILQTVGFISKNKSNALPAGSLEFKKVKDLNLETYSEGPYINAVEFHPTSSVGLITGSRGIATLVAVDGKKNNKLHSVAFEGYPILCAKFSRNGNEAILGSKREHMYIYDLMAAKSLRYKLAPGMTHCKKFVVSPDSQYFAVAGRWGEVHVLSTVSKERLFTLKQEHEITAIEYSANGNCLFGHSDSGEVTIWDINSRRVQHKFYDDGCLQGTALSVSSSNQFLACGSAQGVVNLYGMEDVMASQTPKPRKTIMNLTTSISNLKFNSTSEMLALSSTELRNAIKLFHVSSTSVLSNFPPALNKLGNLNCINFTPNSGYLAVGNTNSVVSLFRLKHFKNY